jgi:glyoxylase-like metal-dependent hydrolase (beta-lactamase superfamily II)
MSAWTHISTRATSKLLEVASGVYQLPLFGTSSILILEDQVTVVDSGWRGNGRRVLQALAALGRSPQEISYLISTHNHLDHVGGIAQICRDCPAQVAAHQEDITPVPPGGRWLLPNPVHHPALSLLLAPAIALLRPPAFSVDIELQHGSKINALGGLEVVHTPGHTPGSISLYAPREGLLMVGDALQYKGRKLGLPSRVFSADMDQARESVRRLARLEFDTLCFSHFPPIRHNAQKTLRQFADSL